jgi:subtilisin family serine protease
MSGTSMASPHVAGLAALIMQAAGRMLSADELRQALMTAARRQPPAGNEWNARYGVGRVDSVASILGIAQAPFPAPAAVAASTPAPAVEAAASPAGAQPPADALSALLASLSSVANGRGASIRVAIEVNPTAPQP